MAVARSAAHWRTAAGGERLVRKPSRGRRGKAERSERSKAGHPTVKSGHGAVVGSPGRRAPATGSPARSTSARSRPRHPSIDSAAARRAQGLWQQRASPIRPRGEAVPGRSRRSPRFATPAAMAQWTRSTSSGRASSDRRRAEAKTSDPKPGAASAVGQMAKPDRARAVKGGCGIPRRRSARRRKNAAAPQKTACAGDATARSVW